MEEATSLDYLTKTLKKVEQKIKEVTESQSTKYGPKQQKIDLEKQMFEKIQLRDDLKSESRNLKNQLFLFKLTLKAAKDFYKDDSYDRFKSIEDAIMRTLLNNYLNKQSIKAQKVV